MKKIIQNIFDNVKYWKEKSMLLKAIPSEYFDNKEIVLLLLNIPDNLLDIKNQAKTQMWNHMIVSQKLGDDILNKTNSSVLDDIDFAKKAIYKYNRTYIYLNEQLQENFDIASSAASNETNDKKYRTPIMMFMPNEMQNNIDISLMACSRNIHNIQYAPKLQSNRYFIIDIMNSLDTLEDKRKVLSYIDQSLLDDKIFVSKLGCFDNLCDRFQGDILYVSNAVKYDITILNKTQLFHDSILSSVINSEYYETNTDEALVTIFRYIKRFNNTFYEFEHKIDDKNIIYKLMWDMGEVIDCEFI